MREKSIREKLGKAISKWIVITLLAGMLVPAMPKEVKADTEHTIDYNLTDGVTIKGSSSVSMNYFLNIKNGDETISDSFTAISCNKSEQVDKRWTADAINTEIRNYLSNDANYLHNLKFVVTAKNLDTGNSTEKIVGENSYKSVTAVKVGSSTEKIYIISGSTVNLSTATVEPAGATIQVISWNRATGGAKYESGILSLESTVNNPTITATVQDGRFKGVHFTKEFKIEVASPELKDNYYYLSSSASPTTLHTITKDGKLAVEYQVPSGVTGITLTDGNKLKGITKGTHTLYAIIKDGNGSGDNLTKEIPVYVDPIEITSPSEETVMAGETVALSASLPDEMSGKTVVWKVNGTSNTTGSFAASSATGTEYTIEASLQDDSAISTIKKVKTTDTVNITLNGTDSITKGYKASFTATTPVNCNFTWKASKSTESKKTENATNSKSSTFSFKPTTTGSYTITCTATYGGKTFTKTTTMTVNRPPEISYDKSNRKITIFLPENIETGDSDTEDVELYSIDGYKLEYEFDGTKKSKTVDSLDIGDSGKTITISETDVKSYVKDVIDGKSFDEKKVTFKLIPRSGEDESKLNPTCEANVSKITVTADSSNSAAFSTQTYYGLEGVSQSITATPNSGYTFLKWSDGNTSKTRTVNFGEKASTYYAISKEGATPTPGPGTTVPKAGGAAGDGLDSVPKTAQNMIPFFMIMLAAFAAAAVVFVLVKNTMGQPAGSNIPESLKLLDFSSKNDKDKK